MSMDHESKIDTSQVADRRILRLTAIFSVIFGILKVGLVQAKYETLGNLIDLALVLLAPLCYGALYYRLIITKASQLAKVIGTKVASWATRRKSCSHDVEKGLEEGYPEPVAAHCTSQQDAEGDHLHDDTANVGDILVGSSAQPMATLPELHQASPSVAKVSCVENKETNHFHSGTKTPRPLPTPPHASSSVSAYNQVVEARVHPASHSRPSSPANDGETPPRSLKNDPPPYVGKGESEGNPPIPLHPADDATSSNASSLVPLDHLGIAVTSEMANIDGLGEEISDSSSNSPVEHNPSKEKIRVNLLANLNPPDYNDIDNPTDVAPPTYSVIKLTSRSPTLIDDKKNVIARSIFRQSMNNRSPLVLANTQDHILDKGKRKAIISPQTPSIPGFHLPFRMTLGPEAMQAGGSAATTTTATVE